MNESFAPFDERFQEPPRANAAHPFFLEARRRLVERRDDLKSPRPHILSCFGLQGVNDPLGRLEKIQRALPSGGLFFGVLAGNETLCELRLCLAEAEIELSGGAHPRVAPMPEAETLHKHMQVAGFSDVVVDLERTTLVYADLFDLARDLRAFGFANNLSARSRRFAPRRLFVRANEIYAARFPSASGGIAATADLIFLHGAKE